MRIRIVFKLWHKLVHLIVFIFIVILNVNVYFTFSVVYNNELIYEYDNKTSSVSYAESVWITEQLNWWG